MNPCEVISEQPTLLFSQEAINEYLDAKRNSGVAETAIKKYTTSLTRLYEWLGADKTLSHERLKAWRTSLDAHGYNKLTVQTYVKNVNDFLRFHGYEQLCIPKPLRNDLTGRTFGYLTAIEPLNQRNGKRMMWRCICKCGNETEVRATELQCGKSTSCGCLNMEILRHRNRYEEGTELRQALEERIKNPHSISGYVGVQPKRDKWIAYINYKKKHYCLGTFSNIEDAVKARARAKEAVMEDAERIYQETDHLYGDPPRRPPRPPKRPPVHNEPVAIPARRGDNTSGCTGVTKQYGKWNVKISYKGRRYPLGSYDDLEAAIAIRKQAEQHVQNDDLEALLSMATGAGVINNRTAAEQKENDSEVTHA